MKLHLRISPNLRAACADAGWHHTGSTSVTLISQPVRRTDLLLGLVQFSNQITREAMLFNVTSESFKLLILLYYAMKYILKRFGSFCNR